QLNDAIDFFERDIGGKPGSIKRHCSFSQSVTAPVTVWLNGDPTVRGQHRGKAGNRHSARCAPRLFPRLHCPGLVWENTEVCQPVPELRR
ncbi:MAG TPA: hypothetical protein VE993_05280, partial [Stellaceae bacterium]|nr:hypothetical protein [Stellaceae bacterium]